MAERSGAPPQTARAHYSGGADVDGAARLDDPVAIRCQHERLVRVAYCEKRSVRERELDFRVEAVDDVIRQVVDAGVYCLKALCPRLDREQSQHVVIARCEVVPNPADPLLPCDSR